MKTHLRHPHLLRYVSAGGCCLLALCGVLPTVRADRPRDFQPADFAVPVWAESDGMIVIEAEDIPFSDNWELRKTAAEDGSKATGKGYLTWVGPNQGHRQETDPQQQYQGDHKDWLVIRTNLSKGGWFTFNLRIVHTKFDGDNDVWMGQLGNTNAVQRAGSNEPGQFHWLGWGVQIFALRKGPDALYVTGRSPGFGIDRIAIYRVDSAERALDPTTPVSGLFQNNPLTGDGFTETGNGWKWSTWGFFHDFAYPFIYHNDHAWLFLVGTDPAGFYFYRFLDGRWCWTGLPYFPFHYDFGREEWTNQGSDRDF